MAEKRPAVEAEPVRLVFCLFSDQILFAKTLETSFLSTKRKQHGYRVCTAKIELIGTVFPRCLVVGLGNRDVMLVGNP